jgi:hypothetical protein
MMKFQVDLDTLPEIVYDAENDHFYNYYTANVNSYWWFSKYFEDKKLTRLAPQGREVVVIF